MATNFPASLDSLTNPTSSDSLNSPSHSAQHANVNDAVEALQAKVGVDSSAVTSSFDYKVAQLESDVSGLVTGKILQVVSTTKTDTFSASVAGNGANSNVTGFSATITPSSTSSTIYVVGMAYGSSSTSFFISIDIDRNGTNIINAASPSLRTPALVGTRGLGTNGQYGMAQIPFAIMDSPASISALTYQVRFVNTTASTETFYLNRTEDDLDNSQRGRAISAITLMEVSA